RLALLLTNLKTVTSSGVMKIKRLAMCVVTLTILLKTALARIIPTVKNQNSRNFTKSFAQLNIAIILRLRIKNRQMVKVSLMLTLPNLGEGIPRILTQGLIRVEVTRVLVDLGTKTILTLLEEELLLVALCMRKKVKV